ncbi:MAG: N-acetyltransferase family protein [Sphingomonadaceae bacterium]
MPIREFAEPDLPAVLAIYADAKLDEFVHEPLSFSLLPLEQDSERMGYFRASEVLVFADADGVVQGFGARGGQQIRAMFVRRAARGQGVGRQLLEQLLQGMAGPVGLNVVASNAGARALYQRYGFHAVEETLTQYNGTPVTYLSMLR